MGETDSGAGKETQLVTGAPDVHTSGDGGGNLKNTDRSFFCLIVPSHEEEDFLNNAADK